MLNAKAMKLAICADLAESMREVIFLAEFKSLSAGISTSHGHYCQWLMHAFFFERAVALAFCKARSNWLSRPRRKVSST